MYMFRIFSWFRKGGWLLCLLTVLVLGAWHHFRQLEDLRLEVEKESAANAGFKVQRLAGWHSEQGADAGVPQPHDPLAAAMAGLPDYPGGPGQWELVKDLRLVSEQHGDSGMILVNATTMERVWLPQGRGAGRRESGVTPEGSPGGQEVCLYRSARMGEMQVAPCASIIAPRFEGAEPAARLRDRNLLLIHEGNDNLYPLLQHWPNQGKDGETLFGRQERKHVLRLNDQFAKPSGHEVEVTGEALPDADAHQSSLAKLDRVATFADWRGRTMLLLTGSLLCFAALFRASCPRWLQDVDAETVHQGELSSRAELERQSLVLRSIGDGVIGVDTSGRVDLINAAAERMTGWEKEAACGLFLGEVFVLLDDRTSQPVPDPTQEVLAAGNTMEFACHAVLVARNGQRRHVPGSAAPLRDMNGKPAGVVLVFRDVSARYRTRETIRQERHLLRHYVDQSPVASIMLDRNMLCLAVSRRFLTDYHLADLPVVGQSVYDIFPGLPERWRQVHQRCLQGNDEEFEEDSFLRQDGRREWIRWACRPWFEESGDVGGLMLFTELISARKEAEFALAKTSQRMANLLKASPAVILP